MAGDDWTRERFKRLEDSIVALDRRGAELRAADHRAIEIAENLRNQALVLARDEMNQRLEKMNEFRSALNDVQSTMMPRSEATQVFDQLQKRVEQSALGAAGFVSRETFDQYKKDEAEKHDRVLSQLSVTYQDISNMKGRNAAYTAAIGVFFTIVALGMRFIGQ